VERVVFIEWIDADGSRKNVSFVPEACWRRSGASIDNAMLGGVPLSSTSSVMRCYFSGLVSMYPPSLDQTSILTTRCTNFGSHGPQ
jgi:hypothetical protein